MRKTLAILVCIGQILAFGPSVLGADGVISVKPLENSVLVDSDIKVDIRAASLKNVYGISFEVVFNARSIKFIDLEEGILIKTDPKPMFQYKVGFNKDVGKIYIGLSYTDNKTNFKDSGTFFTVKFRGLLPGKTKIELQKAQGRRVNFDPIEVSTEAAEIKVVAPATKPIVDADPTELDFGLLKFDETKTLKVHVTNNGKTGLTGTTEPQNLWISADPVKFERDELDIAITVAPKENMGLIVNQAQMGRLSIFTNGGAQDIICKFFLQDKTPVDDFPPDLTIDEPKDEALFSDTKIKLRGRTNPGARLYVNGTPYPIGNDGSFLVDVQLLEGLNRIEVKAVKENGLETIKSVIVRLDTVKPVLQVKDPGNTVNSSYICVEGITEKGSLVRAGGKPVQVDSSGKFRVCFDLVKGDNELTVVSQDPAGNSSVWTKKVFYKPQEVVKITMWIGNPKATVNGQNVIMDAPPEVKNGRTFVPIRFVSENMKATVEWEVSTRSATVIGKEHRCIVSIDSVLAFLDGKVKKLEAAPYIKVGRTMIPLRFIAQDTLGGSVSYDANEKRIDITLVFDL